MPTIFIASNLNTNIYARVGGAVRKIFPLISFLLTVVISIKSIWFMKSQSANLSEKVNGIMKMFRNILITQMMIPVISMFVPLTMMIFIALIKIDLDISEWPIILMTWAAPLNALTNLLVIAPYRRELLRIFCMCFSIKSVNTNSLIVFSTTRNS
ncbi:hypothetical protein M3Y98_00071300 [Aphelenchoides besseyi]|nr:hypothetical protein M3Y98_00071300 [Aphelenchoides besseyi]